MRKIFPHCDRHPFDTSPPSLQHGKEPSGRYGEEGVIYKGPPDPRAQRERLLEAAGKGNRRAIWMIGAGYQVGRWGFPEDKDLAMKWYRILIALWHEDARKGDPDAKAVLKILDELHLPGREPRGK